MTIEFNLIKSENLKEEEIEIFEKLLEEQGQVNTSKGKAKRCNQICIVKVNQEAIGIGALKEVYKRPFEYADVENLKKEYNYELGYLFVKDIANLRGLGIGKYISKLLLNSVIEDNIFATTEFSQKNPMYHILKSFKFCSIGKIYLGKTTNKQLTLMTLNR
jgi:hypothetical protein